MTLIRLLYLLTALFRSSFVRSKISYYDNIQYAYNCYEPLTFKSQLEEFVIDLLFFPNEYKRMLF